MSNLRFCLLLAVLYSCSYLGHGDPVTTPKSEMIDLQPQHVTNTKKSPAEAPSSTTAEESAKMSLDTSKPEPSPSSSLIPETKPSSLTNDATISAPTTDPTTDSPAPEPTTPTPAPTPDPKPTPAPGPMPPPDQGLWAVNDDKKNITCIVVQFAAQLNVTYSNDIDNPTQLDHFLLNVPANATSYGSCDGIDQWLTIKWIAPGTNLTNIMTLVFHKNISSNNFCMKTLHISLTPELFHNASFKNMVGLYHGMEWQTPLSTSYRCTAPTRLNMTSDQGSLVAELTLTHLQEEAFREVPGNGFSAARECGTPDIPDAVPIAVGCALGGLVLVVLGAYLVARRRSAARGYLSM